MKPTSSTPSACPREQVWYVVALIGVIGLGLASRRFPILFPTIFDKYPGDALWALMVFLAWGIVFPRSSTFCILIYTLVTCSSVELLKLYRAVWIDHLRSTTLGHLVLGSTFSWANLSAYTIGAALGALGERLLHSQETRNTPSS